MASNSTRNPSPPPRTPEKRRGQLSGRSSGEKRSILRVNGSDYNEEREIISPQSNSRGSSSSGGKEFGSSVAPALLVVSTRAAMRSIVLWALLLRLLRGWKAIASNATDALFDVSLHFDGSGGGGAPKANECSVRLHASLEKLRKRHTPVTATGFIDLSGYALHQTLRNAPFDMYVTDIRVRTPGIGNWVRVEKCQFLSRENRLAARILFNDLAVTGNVKLFEENTLLRNPGRYVPSEFCSMTVRLRRAGLGIYAVPRRGRSRGIDVLTEAKFVDPNYVSVHAYGCKINQIFGDKPRYPDGGNRDRYVGSPIHKSNGFGRVNEDLWKGDPLERRSARHPPDLDESAPVETPGVRIITLTPSIPGKEDPLPTVQLHREEESDLNNYHKERILGMKFQHERDRLKAVLHVKNLIAQQANQVFQAHGPFSNFQTHSQKPFHAESQASQNFKPVNFISSITELDENLAPLRPIHQRPQELLFPAANDDKVAASNSNGHDNHHPYEMPVEELSHEMEDMFLRGVKTLLTRYLEKHLEIPLKEALLVNIGYTVSYG